MLNTDKVRGILRAKYGSQVPKFQSPHGPIINNPYMQGSNEVIKKEKEIPPINLDELKVPEWKGPSTLRKTGLLIGNFTKNNPNLVAGGLDAISSFANKSVDINGAGFNTFNKATNIIGNTAMAIPGLQGVGLAVKGVGAVANIVNAIGKKKLKEFGIDPRVQEYTMGSYGGSNSLFNKVKSFEGQTVGTFTGTGSFNKQTDEANRQKSILTDVYNSRQDQLAMINNNGIQYQAWDNQVNGIMSDPRTYISAKKGGSLIQKISLVKSCKFNQVINVDTKQVEEFKDGGKIQAEWEPIIEDLWEPVIDIFQKGGKTRTLEELIEYAKKENPRFVQRLSEEPRGIKFTDDEGNEGEGSHYLEWSTDDFGNAIIYPRIQEIEDGSLKFFPSNEAYQRAVKNKNILTMSPEEANTFFSEDSEYKTAYKRGWPNFFKLFKDGGKTKEELETPQIEETKQKNLIPEGALHKNKHHMEHSEGLTQNGIPVIDNDGEQQAEIELDEIIFTLEVTKKLEELYKDGSDEAAIEAGKLLVKEILFNTDDRTGLISKCEKGGKL